MSEKPKSILERGLQFWFTDQDAIHVRAFEVVITFCMIYYFSFFLLTPRYWLTEVGHHVSERATLSHYLPPPVLVPESWVWFVVPAFYACTIAYPSGYARRILAWLLFSLAVYIQAMDQPSSFTINRMFIISFLILALQPPNREEGGKKWIEGWVPRFFQATLVLQYSTAGVCKMVSGDWLVSPIKKALSGDFTDFWETAANNPLYLINIVEPDTVWSQSQGHYKNIFSAYAVNYMPLPLWWCLAAATMIFETGAIFLFTWKKTRVPIVIFGVVFHLGIAILMKDLIFFSVQMITAYVFFVPSSWLHTLRDKLPAPFDRLLR
ncbi:MAG: hypothetical protein CL916_08645 [Deltaproteobacteria bacterium]|nr:hypothetical protein [Deltaproteobacteria bacterium]